MTMADSETHFQLFKLLVLRLKEKYDIHRNDIDESLRVKDAAFANVVRDYLHTHQLEVGEHDIVRVGDETPFIVKSADIIDEILLHRFGFSAPADQAESEFTLSTKSMLQVLDLGSLDGQDTIPQDPLILLGLPVTLHEVASPERRLSIDAHQAILETTSDLFRVPVLTGETLEWRRGELGALVEGTFFIPSQRVGEKSVLYRLGGVDHGMLSIESYGLVPLDEASELARQVLRESQRSLEERLERNSTPMAAVRSTDLSSELFSDAYIAQLLRHDPRGYILKPQGGNYTSAHMRDTSIGDIFTPKSTPGQPVPFFQVVEKARKHEWEREGAHHYTFIAAIKGVEFPSFVQYLQQGNPVAYITPAVGLSDGLNSSPVAEWLLDSIIPDGAYIHIPGSEEIVLEKSVREGRTAKGDPFSYVIFERADPSRRGYVVGDDDIISGPDSGSAVDGGRSRMREGSGPSTLERDLASSPGVVSVRQNEHGAVIVRVRDGFMGLARGNTSPPAGVGVVFENNDLRGTTTMANGNDNGNTNGGNGADDSSRPTGPMQAGSGGRRIPPPLPSRVAVAPPLSSSAPTVEAQALSTSTVQNLDTQQLQAVIIPGSEVDPTGRTHTAAQVSVPPGPVAPPAAVVPRTRRADVSDAPIPIAPVAAAPARAQQGAGVAVAPLPVPPSEKLTYYDVKTTEGHTLLVNDILGLSKVIERLQKRDTGVGVHDVGKLAEIPVGAFYRKGSDGDSIDKPAPFYVIKDNKEYCFPVDKLSQALADYKLEIVKDRENAVAIALDKDRHAQRVRRAVTLFGVGSVALALGIGGTALYFNSQFNSVRKSVDGLEKALVAADAAEKGAVDKIGAGAATYAARAKDAHALITDFEQFEPQWNRFVSEKYAPVEAKARQVMAYLKIAPSMVDVAAGNLNIADVVARDVRGPSTQVDVVAYAKSICTVDSTAKECFGSDAALIQYWVPFTSNCEDAVGRWYGLAGGAESGKSNFVAKEKGTLCKPDRGQLVQAGQGKTHYKFTVPR